MIGRTTIALALLLGLGVGAHRATAQVPVAASQRIEAAQTHVVQAGIPAELLASKVAEGRAKGVDDERIAAVVERRAANLIRARDALASAGRRVGGPEIAAGADAIEAGVDGNSLRAVIQQARNDNAAVALAVLGELVRQGMPVQQAHERVVAALQRGGDALAALPQQAATARDGRGPPSHAGPPSGVGTPASARPAGVPNAGDRPGGGPPAGSSGGRP
jgi:hypothetical protein